jgi:protein phosphatase
VASRLAVESIENFMRRTTSDDDVTWPYGIDASMSFDGNRLRTAVQLANRRVFKAAEDQEDYSGMGTTVVAVLVRDHQVVVASVGDSRLYAWSEGTLRQLTIDDSWAAAVEKHGPAPGGPAKPSMRHVLTNVIGAQGSVEFDVMERATVAEERLLLCSDGLHSEISDEVISEVLSGSAAPEAMAAALIERTLATPARDNVTAVVIHLAPAR